MVQFQSQILTINCRNLVAVGLVPRDAVVSPFVPSYSLTMRRRQTAALGVYRSYASPHYLFEALSENDSGIGG